VISRALTLAVAAAAALTGLSAGCARATLTANTNTNGDANADGAPIPPPTIDTSTPETRSAFIGVTHALNLTPAAAAQPRCRCMAAAVGIPSDPAFAWRGRPPTVGDEALVVGISNDGTPCDRPVGGHGPSIQAVEVEGNNVVVTLEESRNGRPLARGAIFQKPSSDGYIIFRAAGRLPYDDALPGTDSAVCRIRFGSPSSAAPSTTSTNRTYSDVPTTVD
jgi:hypothetical protein